MSIRLKLRRGLRANLPALSEGEMGFATDEKKLFIGSDSGNVEITRPKTSINLLYNADPGAPGAVWNDGTSFTNLAPGRYTAEGWVYASAIAVAAPNISKVANGMAVTAPGTSDAIIAQYVEQYGATYAGKPVSVAVSIDGAVYRFSIASLAASSPPLSTPKANVRVFIRPDDMSQIVFTIDMLPGVTAVVNWAHLAPGDVDIVHVPDDPATTAIKCLRYYEKGTLMSKRDYVYSSWLATPGGIFFKVRKRAIPTITILSSQNGVAGYMSEYDVGGTFMVDRKCSANQRTVEEFVVDSSDGTLVAGRFVGYGWLADARIY